VTPLPLPEPYDFTLSTERFRVFGRDPVNLWHEGALYRVVGGREVRIDEHGAEPLDAETEPVVLHLLGAPFDLDAFYAFAEGDPVLAELTRRLRGFRPPLVPDPWEAVVSSICAQQVSMQSALAIRARFVERYGEQVGRAWTFPARERVARESSEPELFALGFSHRKAEYVLALAQAELELAALAALPDDEVRAAITAERGLGDWTADWFLARHLGRPTPWPAGDLALRKAAARFYSEDVHTVGRRVHPFQNLAAHYLLTGARTP
jgi:DNA-3-methyladenine glycosylase II